MSLSFGSQTGKYFSRPHTSVPAGPIDHPSVWYGADFSNQLPVERFSAEEVEELEVAAKKLVQKDVPLDAVTAVSFPLPTTSTRLKSVAQQVSQGRGFAILRGLPVGVWDDVLTEYVYWGIGQHIGRPGEQNPQGEKLGHVVDYNEEATNPLVRRYRTAGNIDFHCDGADAVGLLCLRMAKSGGQSRIASSVTIFNELLKQHADLAPALFSPIYMDRRDEEGEGHAPCGQVQPACFDGDKLRTFYHSEYFRSAARHPGFEPSEQQLALLDAYDAIAARPDVHLDMWLEPGDLQIVSNHTVVHARTAYVDHDDPELARHLLRLWLSMDIT